MATDESMFIDMLNHVRGGNIDEIAHDDSFVYTLHGSTVEDATPALVDLYDCLIDMMHDRFSLNSSQRKSLKASLYDKSKTLRELYDMFKQSEDYDNMLTAGLAEHAPLYVEEAQAPAEASPSPPSSPPRFGDVAGILQQQPLVQLVGEALASAPATPPMAGGATSPYPAAPAPAARSPSGASGLSTRSQALRDLKINLTSGPTGATGRTTHAAVKATGIPQSGFRLLCQPMGAV